MAEEVKKEEVKKVTKDKASGKALNDERVAKLKKLNGMTESAEKNRDLKAGKVKKK